jgi:hypothetical protein
MISAEDLSAALNAPLRLLNGGLTDINVREIEGAVGGIGANTGIPESKIAFSDNDGVGHNHDGFNSAPIAEGSVVSPVMEPDAHFLNGAWGTLPDPPNQLYTVAGKGIYRQETDLSSQFLVHFVIPYDPNLFDAVTPFIANTERCVASTWFISADASVNNSVIMNSTYRPTITIDTTNYYIRLAMAVQINSASAPIVAGTYYVGCHWVFSVQCNFADPTD